MSSCGYATAAVPIAKARMRILVISGIISVSPVYEIKHFGRWLPTTNVIPITLGSKRAPDSEKTIRNGEIPRYMEGVVTRVTAQAVLAHG